MKKLPSYVATARTVTDVTGLYEVIAGIIDNAEYGIDFYDLWQRVIKDGAAKRLRMNAEEVREVIKAMELEGFIYKSPEDLMTYRTS